MIITSIEVNKSVAAMAQVYLENNTCFCLPLKRIKLLDLCENKTITDETLEYILKYEVYDAAKSAAVKFLSFKLRTSYEITQKLIELGYNEEIVTKVIESLIEIDYINDYKYATKYISEKTKLQPKSIKMLSMELSCKGIPDNIISSVLEELNISEASIALKLLRKRFSKQTFFDDKVITKMKSFLTNKGFSYSQTAKAISEFLPDIQDCPD